MLLLDKLVGHVIPVRFIAFSIVGGLGVIVHLLVLSVAFKALHVPFVPSQALAALSAMTFNFSVNNVLTYRDVRLRGWLSFVLVCGVGAVGNVGVASYLYNEHSAWIPAAIAGILVGVVWNYVASTTLTWGKPNRK
jgi:dolichol-phosphate mannosyltransferase